MGAPPPNPRLVGRYRGLRVGGGFASPPPHPPLRFLRRLRLLKLLPRTILGSLPGGDDDDNDDNTTRKHLILVSPPSRGRNTS